MPSYREYKRLAAITAALMLGASLTSSINAETLQGALRQAYDTNPTLQAARAGQRATDEGVNVELANGRPSLSASGSYSENVERPNAFTAAERSVSASTNFNVPIYSGGAVRNAINAAKLRVESGQNDLRGTESSIFSAVVAAYMDVIRDSAIVSLNRQNVKALEVNLRASRDRFEVGDVTRTDVAQSESRLSLARADLQRSGSNLIASKERYISLVGASPDNLEMPPALPGLPASADEAVAIALRDNGDILSAQKARDAARYDVKVAKAQAAPRLSAFAQGSYQDYLKTQPNYPTFTPHSSSATVGANLTLPLYQGGRPGALARQSAAKEARAIENAIAIERNVIAQTRSAYASWQASLQAIESTRTAVEAAALSLEGVKAENSVGNRTILDILNAEQEALNARVQLVTAERNAYVAGFSLLAAMGHAEARDLSLEGGALYNAADHYAQVKGKLFDYDFGSAPKAVSTTTAQIPATDAEPANIVRPAGQ